MIFFAATMSLIMAIAMHFVPPSFDCFDGAVYQGRSIKIFRRGWPHIYVIEGELRDSGGMIAQKVATSFAINATLFYLAALGISIIGRRSLITGIQRVAIL
jgi:hypothetical protein